MIPEGVQSKCKQCTSCFKGFDKAVDGVGPTPALIMVVTESPGAEEVKYGIPLKGETGKIFDRALEDAGISRDDIYITSVVKCRTTDQGGLVNRAPNTVEIQACGDLLDEEIRRVQPKVIIPMGNSALQRIEGRKGGITKRKGEPVSLTEAGSPPIKAIIEMLSSKGEEPYTVLSIPTVNPAFVIRNLHEMDSFTEDLKFAHSMALGKEIEKEEGESVDHDYRLVSTMEQFEELCNELDSKPFWAFDIESAGLGDFDSVIGIAFSWEEYTGRYLPIMIRPDEVVIGEDILVDYWEDNQSVIWERVREVFTNGAAKVGHNVKFDCRLLRFQHDVHVHNLKMDTMILHHLVDENTRHGLDILTRKYADIAGYKPIFWAKVPGKDPSRALLQDISDYACGDADGTLRLALDLPEELDDKGIEFCDKMQIPLLNALIEAECTGVLFDGPYAEYMGKEYLSRSETLKKEVENEVGFEVNPRSSLQMRKLLFDHLKLPVLGTTPKGDPSTGKAVLAELAKLNPLVHKLEESRRLAALEGTYFRGFKERAHPNGTIHTTYRITGTETGRLSSSDPNLQNVPRAAKEVKKVLVAHNGSVFITADYGQMEVRILAWYAQEESILQWFAEGRDIYTVVTSELLGIPEDDVSKEQRQVGKAITLGIGYGMSAHGLSQDSKLNLTEEEARAHVATYFRRFPKIKKFTEKTQSILKQYGRAQSVFGRTRRVPNVWSSDPKDKSHALRAGLNAIIQGTAADYTNNAFVRCYQNLIGSGKYRAQPLLNVHDSITIEAPLEEAWDVIQIMDATMKAPINPIDVQLEIDMDIGTKWGWGLPIRFLDGKIEISTGDDKGPWSEIEKSELNDYIRWNDYKYFEAKVRDTI